MELKLLSPSSSAANVTVPLESAVKFRPSFLLTLQTFIKLHKDSYMKSLKKHRLDEIKINIYLAYENNLDGVRGLSSRRRCLSRVA
jgi:hypothetical protein